jgi:hypothetical protein
MSPLRGPWRKREKTNKIIDKLCGRFHSEIINIRRISFMGKNIKIMAEDGHVLAIYPLVLGDRNYRPSNEEFFREAIKDAIDDGLITREEAPKVTCAVM